MNFKSKSRIALLARLRRRSSAVMWTPERLDVFWKRFDRVAVQVETGKAIPTIRKAFRKQEEFVLERFDHTWRGMGLKEVPEVIIEDLWPVPSQALYLPMEEALTELVEVALGTWAQDSAASLGITISFDLVDTRAMDYLQRWGAQKVRGINETTRSALQKSLSDGVAYGESIPKLRERIEAVFKESRGYRSEMIARTEVGAAASAGADEAYRQGNFPYKRWVAARDHRTRDAHAAADGQIVEFHLPFRVGGGMLMYPGDPGGSAANVINCRCIHVPEMTATGGDQIIEPGEGEGSNYQVINPQETPTQEPAPEEPVSVGRIR